MTLPSSGQISFNDIRIELGIPTQAPFSLESASKGLYVAINTNSPSYPDGTAPYNLSDWYSYNHNAVACYVLNNTSSLAYATVTPADPTVCSGGGTEYTSNQVFYSTDCSTLAGGCTIYSNSTCTSPAYGGGVRYINDSSNYFSLNGSSVASLDGSCGA
jgi:hypothetical protein